MQRMLFEWHGIKLHAYPVMLYLGILIGVMGGTYGAGLHGLDPVRAYAALLLLFPVSLVGARLLFIMTHWRLYRRQPDRIWRQSEGGASLYGGLVLSVWSPSPVLKILKLPFGAFWDAASITLLTGMIFTKVGCFLNGCCAGRPTSARLALYLPDHQGICCRRVPTQLLEAGLAAIILLGLVGLWNRLPFAGALFLYTVAAYSAGRWWLEATREDIEAIGPYSLHRTISVILLAACLTSFMFMWPHQP